MKEAVILKSGSSAPSEEELARINRYARKPLTAEEVYVFPLRLCDNEVDRDLERFSDDTLRGLAALFLGKTGIFDHSHRAANQTARIFFTEFVRSAGEKNSLGEDYCYLSAKAYLLRCNKNEELIREIDAGIKKEVSVGCRVERVRCSVCGADLRAAPCAHVKGRKYGGRVCHHVLEEPSDAYEWSFVAVPAQQAAGVLKGFGGLPDPETVAKSLRSGGDVALSRVEAQSLADYIQALKTAGADGETYRRKLKSEVVKLAVLISPELGPELMESVAEKLSTKELEAVQEGQKRKLGLIGPFAPQLAAGKERNPAEIGDFLI